jgi:hypothetical protein
MNRDSGSKEIVSREDREDLGLPNQGVTDCVKPDGRGAGTGVYDREKGQFQ